MTTVLADQHDRNRTRRRRHEGRQDERRRMPHLEQESAADQRRAERDSPHDVLDPLRAPIGRRRQDVRVEPSVRRLVHVVREEERQHDERRRPQIGHERHQQEAEAHRPERREHERTPTAERCVERVAPRADDRREREREHALGAEDETDQRSRLREAVKQRRQVRRGRGDREREAEGSRSRGSRRDSS